jgi:hypothetical protein
MNCDEAFEALTDMDGNHADDLELHLSGCPRCRQMREVLAPALCLFSPTDDDCFSHGSGDASATVRQQFLTVEAVQLAKEAALALSAREQSSMTLRRSTVKRVAVQATLAAAAVVATFAVLFAPTRHEPANVGQSAVVAPVASTPCVWKERLQADHAKHEATVVVASCVACHLNGPIQ